MNKKFTDELAKLIPEGFSKSGLKEVGNLIENTVNDRVEEEMKDLTAKVSGFLRMKINELKEEALKELENEDETFRAVKVYESLKSIVAEDINSKDSESSVSFYKEENEKLQNSVDGLNNKVSHLMAENNSLDEAVVSLREDVSVLSETKKTPFKSSESALVITNEDQHQTSLSQPAVENAFLTEDVIRLSNK